MNRISLMTMSVLVEGYHSYKNLQKKEVLEEYYIELMAAVQEAGYWGVDITDYEVKILGLEFIKKVLREYELAVSSYIHFAHFANSDEGMKNRIETAKKEADIARELGSKVYMLVPIAHEGIENIKPEEIRHTMIEHWSKVVPYVVSLGLCPVIEDTPDLRLCLDKVVEVKEVLNAVPGLQLVYDSGNMVLDGEDPVEYVKAFEGQIGFVHLKDIQIMPEGYEGREKMSDGRSVRGVPTGTGIININSVVKALLETGYKGGMTVEYVKDPIKSHLECFKEAREYIDNCMKNNR